MHFLHLLLSSLLILSTQVSFAQKSNNIEKFYFRHNNTNGTIRAFAGQNYQFLDNPFFSTESTRHSDITFNTVGAKSFGLEMITPKPIFKNTYFINGLYYEESDMGYSLASKNSYTPGNVSAGLGGSGAMDGRLMFVGIAGGLYHEYNLSGRFVFSLSTLLNVGTFIMDRNLKDTLMENKEERTRPFFDQITLIKMPPKTNSLINIRLKNEAVISYYVSKTIAFNFGLVYNVGLPNKAFERSFYIYNPDDLTKPAGYEKAVFSNSSLEFLFGMNVSL